MKKEKKVYEPSIYIQTLMDDSKRIVVSLFTIEKKLVKQYFINIKEDDFYE